MEDWSDVFNLSDLTTLNIPTTDSVVETLPDHDTTNSMYLDDVAFSTGLTPPSSDTSTADSCSNPMFSASELLHKVCSYVSLLFHDHYRSPLIHHTLYKDSHVDIAAMPQSRTVLCYHAALAHHENGLFVRRAMVAERERLMHEFVGHFKADSTATLFFQILLPPILRHISSIFLLTTCTSVMMSLILTIAPIFLRRRVGCSPRHVSSPTIFNHISSPRFKRISVEA